MECLARGMSLLHSYGFDHNSDASKKRVTLPEYVSTELSFDDDGEFKEVCCGDATMCSVTDGIDITLGIRLFRQDRDERRSV